jgi:nucleoside phosphorylase
MLRADVLIVTAIKEEFDALIAVEEGAVSGSVWRSETLEDARIYAMRRFTHPNSAHAFTVVATWATRMGEVAAVTAAVPLIERFRPRAIAMCGVCAGRRGDVQRGDVICASQVWQYEAGKSIVDYDDDGQRREDFKASLMVHQPDRPWVQAAQAFRPDTTWLRETPRPPLPGGSGTLDTSGAVRRYLSAPACTGKRAQTARPGLGKGALLSGEEEVAPGF